MARWVEVAASKPDDLSSFLGTHTVERHNQDPHTVLGLPHVTVAHPREHAC
ncbi:hypothetical protein I79_004106 [Cricetulus griseus]|uniref:Uncharacterized protein n=1 Tax=Cricetulus griseus TaxID=10029 RepID=G3H1S4_CRIGR|nr:hypothetical protein I79_004106 [Cricetulus griseus]